MGRINKLRRAQIPFKTDADGPVWTDQKIAEAFCCRTKRVEDLRQRLVELGVEKTLERKKSQGTDAYSTADIFNSLSMNKSTHVCSETQKANTAVGGISAGFERS